MKNFLLAKTRRQERFTIDCLRKLETPSILAIDFDGCLTDDHVFVDENGGEFVRASRKDGLGAGRLKALGITVLIVSTEKNPIVSHRANKMQVEVRQAVHDKKKTLGDYAKVKGVNREKIWAVGNDVNDIGLFDSAGFTMCPSDASTEVKLIANLVLPLKGGDGILNFLAGAIEASNKLT